jgi:hypothetical protein
MGLLEQRGFTRRRKKLSMLLDKTFGITGAANSASKVWMGASVKKTRSLQAMTPVLPRTSDSNWICPFE